MQITIDSNESLSTVTSVIGALYGVELTVSGRGASAAATNNGRRGGRRATKAAKATKTTRRTAAGGRRGGRRPGGADPSVIRQWAVNQGLTVSTRGQLSKSVLDAYRAAHR